MRKASDQLVENIKTNNLIAVRLFFENRAVYEITWKIIVEQGSPQMTIWCMSIASWVPKATNPHSDRVILIAFPL